MRRHFVVGSLPVFCLLLTIMTPGCQESVLNTGTKAVAPTFNPVPGNFSESLDIVLSSADSDATIYYTLDASDPSNIHGMVYSGPIHLTATATITAIAYKPGILPSDIVQATYTQVGIRNTPDPNQNGGGTNYTITTTKTGHGSLLLSPYQTAYAAGSSVQVTAIPEAGWALDHWEGDASGTANPVTVVTDASKTVRAVFVQKSTPTIVILNPAIASTPLPAQDQSSAITVTCIVIDSGGTIQSVTADLSQIGGSATQVLTRGDANAWSWSGDLVPRSSGLKKITFTAIDTQGPTATANTYITVKAPHAPPTILNPDVAADNAFYTNIPIPVTVSCDVVASEGVVTSVIADLSAIGGSATQTLTLGTSSHWMWQGMVTPTVTGTRTVTISATDSYNATAVAIVTKTVSDPNPPPVISNASVTEPLFQGRAVDNFTVTCTIDDPDGIILLAMVDLSVIDNTLTDNVSLGKVSGSDNGTWQSPPQRVTPTGNGTKTVTIYVTDKFGRVTTSDVKVTVAGINVTTPASDIDSSLDNSTPLDNVTVSWNIVGLDLAQRTVAIYLDNASSTPSVQPLAVVPAATPGSTMVDLAGRPAGTYIIRAAVVDTDNHTSIVSGEAPGKIIISPSFYGVFHLADMVEGSYRGFSPLDGTVFEGYQPNDGVGYQVSRLGDMNNDSYGDILIFSRYGQEANNGNSGSGYLIHGSSNITKIPMKTPVPGGQAPNACVFSLGKMLEPTPPLTGSILLLPMENLATPPSNFDTVTMDRDRIVTVVFENRPDVKSSLTLVVDNTSGNGTLTASPASATGQYDDKAKVKLTAVPDAGYRVKSWQGTDDDSSTAFTNTVVMHPNRSVTVAFEAIPAGPTWNLICEVNGGHGVLLPAKGQVGTISGNYDDGVMVSLTAVPDDGYTVDNTSWTGTDNDTLDTLTNTVTMTSTKVVTVTFKPMPGPLCTLTARVVGGHGNLVPLGTWTYPVGSVVHLKAIPDAGWRVRDWIGSDRTNPTYGYSVAAVPDVSGGDGKGDLLIGCPDAAPLIWEWNNDTLFDITMTDGYNINRTAGWGGFFAEPMHVLPSLFKGSQREFDCRQDNVDWLASNPRTRMLWNGFSYGFDYLPGDRLTVTNIDQPTDAAASLLKITGTGSLGPNSSTNVSYAKVPYQVVEFSDAMFVAKEADTITITAIRHGGHISGRLNRVQVNWMIDPAGTTAVAGVDYVDPGTPPAFVFEAGQTRASVTIKTLSNLTDHTDKVIALKLMPGSVILGPQNTATATIVNATGIITVTPTSGEIVTDGTCQYTVSLDYRPAANVDVRLSSYIYTTVTPDVLTFTPANWDVPQTVEVKGAFVGTSVIHHTVISDDLNFAGLTLPDVTVNVYAADAKVILINPMSVTLAPGGATTYDIVLVGQARDNVTVTLTVPPNLRCAPSVVVLDNTSKNPQHIVVQAIAPGVDNITHTSASRDPAYDNITISPFTVTTAVPPPAPSATIEFSAAQYDRPAFMNDADRFITVIRTGSCKRADNVTYEFQIGSQKLTGTATFDVGDVVARNLDNLTLTTIDVAYHRVTTRLEWTPDASIRGATYLVTSQELDLYRSNGCLDMGKIGSPAEDTFGGADVSQYIVPVDSSSYGGPHGAPYYSHMVNTELIDPVLPHAVERSMMTTPSNPGTFFGTNITMIPDVSNRNDIADFAVTVKTGSVVDLADPAFPVRDRAGYVNIYDGINRFTSLRGNIGQIAWHIPMLSGGFSGWPNGVDGDMLYVTVLGSDNDTTIAGVTNMGRIAPLNDLSQFGRGDFNGDGLSDFAVTSPGVRNSSGDIVGASYLVLARPLINRRAHIIDLADFNRDNITGWSNTSLEVPVLGVKVKGTPTDRITQNAECAGNFNGVASVVENIPQTGMVFAFPDATVDNKTECGKIVIMFGAEGLMGDFTMDDIGTSQASPIKGLVIAGENAGDHFGQRVCCVGDVNGDGVDDLLVSAPNANDPARGKTNCGKVYLIYGKANIVKLPPGQQTGPVKDWMYYVDYDGDNNTAGDPVIGVGSLVTTLRQGSVFVGEDNDMAIEAISPAGDVNKDGLADFLIGSPYSNVSAMQQRAGRAFLILGRSYALPRP